MGRSISPMREETIAGSDPRIAPRLIVPMSLQLVIPRRVALQQSSPPLHQPSVILKEKRKFEKENPLNGMCANSKLPQQKGSPHFTVPKLCQILLLNRSCARFQRHLVGFAVHFLQGLPLPLQFHLPIPFEDLFVALSKELCNPLVRDTACS